MEMSRITYREALTAALREELRADERVFLMGTDLQDPHSGSFKVERGLSTEFGNDRIFNTPISEIVIAGGALGAAMTGMRPVAEIMYMDFFGCAMDQIMNQIAKIRYMSGGQIQVPLTLITQQGVGRSSAAQHSQSLEAIFAHIPGLKIAMPATPYEAKGMLRSAIRDNNPVIFIEHKMLYNVRGEVPDEEYFVPLGEARICREGADLTIVATLAMVQKALEAAEILEKEGISAEVIDPRTIVPLDEKTIFESLEKTNRLMVVHEAVTRCGWGAELCGLVMDKAFDLLDAPVKRLGGKNIPIPFAPNLEEYAIPRVEEIVEAARELVG